MFLQAFADFERQVQPGKSGIRVFQQLDHTQTLPVMVEATMFAHAFRQHLFARMSERRMAEIVRKRDGFGQIFVQ